MFDRVFFVHYTNESTLTLLRNSLFNNNKKQNIFSLLLKASKMGGDKLMKKVSPIYGKCRNNLKFQTNGGSPGHNRKNTIAYRPILPNVSWPMFC